MAPLDTGHPAFDGEVDQALRFVSHGISVAFTGIRGSGRSMLLDRVSTRITDEGRQVLRVDGISAWHQEPFGALMSLGDEMDVTRRSLREVTTALERYISNRAPVLVCDDADDLDLQSVGALQAAQRRARFVGVMTQRPASELDSFGIARTARIPVPPLGLSQLADLATEMLDGPVETRTLSLIASRSGGLYGISRAILTIARLSGQLTQSPSGHWMLAGELWSDLLAGTLAPLLADLDPPLLEGAQMLAAAGPMPAAEAEPQIGSVRLSQLFTHGLARFVSYGTDSLISIHPPILTDYLSSQNPWRQAQPSLPSGIGDSMSHTTAGLLSAGAAAIIGSRLAREANARALACRADWSADPNPETAMALLLALESAMAPDEELDRVIAQTPCPDGDWATAAFLVMRAWWLANRHGDLAEALTELVSARSRMPTNDTLLRAGEAYLRLMHAEIPAPEVLAPASADADPYASGALALAKAGTLLAQGKTSSAAALLADRSYPHPILRVYGDIWRDLGLVLCGDIGTGVRLALLQLEERRQEINVESAEGLGYVGMLGLVLAGRLHDATRLMDDLLSTFPSRSVRSVFHEGIRALGALVSRWQGRTSHARALAAQSQDRVGAGAPGPFPAMSPLVVDLLVRNTVAGTQIADDLWQVVEEQADAGLIVSALMSALLAVECGPNQAVGDRLNDLAATTESPLLQTVGRYLAAICQQDTTTIKDVVGELTGLEAIMPAVQGAVFTAQILRRQGLLEESAESANHAWELAAPAGPERWGLFAGLAGEVGLSRREYAVLDLLAGGLSASEVATALSMSVRTVETHLHNVGRKVGLSGKDNLVYAAQTWLRPHN